MTDEYIALLRTGSDAFGAGDLDTIRGLFDDNIVWHVGGRSPVAGDYKGTDEVFGFFAKLVELTGGTFKVELHDVLSNGEHSVALARNSGEREGKRLDDNNV